jgi:hypothetical protein
VLFDDHVSCPLLTLFLMDFSVDFKEEVPGLGKYKVALRHDWSIKMCRKMSVPTIVDSDLVGVSSIREDVVVV